MHKILKDGLSNENLPVERMNILRRIATIKDEKGQTATFIVISTALKQTWFTKSALEDIDELLDFILKLQENQNA